MSVVLTRSDTTFSSASGASDSISGESVDSCTPSTPPLGSETPFVDMSLSSSEDSASSASSIIQPISPPAHALTLQSPFTNAKANHLAGFNLGGGALSEVSITNETALAELSRSQALTSPRLSASQHAAARAQPSVQSDLSSKSPGNAYTGGQDAPARPYRLSRAATTGRARAQDRSPSPNSPASSSVISLAQELPSPTVHRDSDTANLITRSDTMTTLTGDRTAMAPMSPGAASRSQPFLWSRSQTERHLPTLASISQTMAQEQGQAESMARSRSAGNGPQPAVRRRHESLMPGSSAGLAASNVARQANVRPPLSSSLASPPPKSSSSVGGLRPRRATLQLPESGTSGSFASSLSSNDPAPRLTAPTRDAMLGSTSSNMVEAKVVILGSQGVGKTSLVHTYIHGEFSNASMSTIGASFATKKIVIDDVRVRLQIWDTAGQERFRSMAPIYYRGSQAAVLVYDITNEESFWDVRRWLDELNGNTDGPIVIHIVGSKLDLAHNGKRAVDLETARRIVNEWAAASPPARSPIQSAFARPAPVHRRSADSSLDRDQDRTRAGLTFGFGLNTRTNSSTSTNTSTSEANARDRKWCQVDVSEVSAVTGEGIEDIFLTITQRVVERQEVMEAERRGERRGSILLTDEVQTAGGPGKSALFGACC
ncbi:uncharacterized protein L969DRAFT_16295 [Mixia osmundae IAM 14324]|uniref:Uncharacterized protein n=1 Tax=Mixia osmundae (strain CBS 9802 / IAM 14324 / JCM 22182 / KY 12970) TaxID=764103 RepID=G7DZJ9_MIXOS|nr:uncharacterized protein L969DRAFT_16295 [Mixia osmundae IAM 14324]KEI40944.1 hypothetical protein L969DRAFT_16295 [Mixia osmundae IAM 14324]GAA96009.1 hypothetical protein E5Q_02669 [Mixia osmundae IAM 14324]